MHVNRSTSSQPFQVQPRDSHTDARHNDKNMANNPDLPVQNNHIFQRKAPWYQRLSCCIAAKKVKEPKPIMTPPPLSEEELRKNKEKKIFEIVKSSPPWMDHRIEMVVDGFRFNLHKGCDASISKLETDIEAFLRKVLKAAIREDYKSDLIQNCADALSILNCVIPAFDKQEFNETSNNKLSSIIAKTLKSKEFRNACMQVIAESPKMKSSDDAFLIFMELAAISDADEIRNAYLQGKISLDGAKDKLKKFAPMEMIRSISNFIDKGTGNAATRVAIQRVAEKFESDFPVPAIKNYVADDCCFIKKGENGKKFWDVDRIKRVLMDMLAAQEKLKLNGECVVRLDEADIGEDSRTEQFNLHKLLSGSKAVRYFFGANKSSFKDFINKAAKDAAHDAREKLTEIYNEWDINLDDAGYRSLTGEYSKINSEIEEVERKRFERYAENFFLCDVQPFDHQEAIKKFEGASNMETQCAQSNLIDEAETSPGAMEKIMRNLNRQTKLKTVDGPFLKPASSFHPLAFNGDEESIDEMDDLS